MKIKLFFCSALLFLSEQASFGAVCTSKPNIIKPLSKSDLKDFFEWANIHKDIMVNHPINAEYLPTYLVDINNDGKKEYVFTTFEGSGHYLSLHIFEKVS